MELQKPVYLWAFLDEARYEAFHMLGTGFPVAVERSPYHMAWIQ